MNKIIIIAGNEEGCGATSIDYSKLRGRYLVINTETGDIQNLSTDKGSIKVAPFVANQTSIENSGDEYVDVLASLIDLIGDKTKVQLAYEKVYNEPIFKSLHETTNELEFVKKENAELKKEIEYLKPRTWFADAVDNICNAIAQAPKEYKTQLESLKQDIEPPRKKLTKREKFWHDVKENIKEYGGQWICVFPKDYDCFIKELEKELPTVVWGNSKKPSEYDPWISSEKRRYIYLDNKEFIYWCGDGTGTKYKANKKVFTYHPPMDWEKFKKGDIVVKVNNQKEFDEFFEEGRELWDKNCAQELKVFTGEKYIIPCHCSHGMQFYLTSELGPYALSQHKDAKIVNWSDMR